LRPARGQDGGARDVGAQFAHRRHAAQDHVIDLGGVQIVAVAQGFQNLRSQRQAGDLVQRAVLLAFAARGADGVIDIGVSHENASPIKDGSKLGRQEPYVYVNVK